ncbi:hypothetical protein [Rhodoferax sp.]|uniref:hypothetical protein n=1 Tax=Rhodoferax sp. TaxID=50421 RepID=UPI00262846EF|nr:hypothetical protein [Rhodoferax sp.]
MTPYRNLSGHSNVVAYESNEDSIHVVFKSGVNRNYFYNSARPGRVVVEEMKRLAALGRGLNAYISSVVKSSYARKW